MDQWEVQIDRGDDQSSKSLATTLREVIAGDIRMLQDLMVKLHFLSMENKAPNP